MEIIHNNLTSNKVDNTIINVTRAKANKEKLVMAPIKMENKNIHLLLKPPLRLKKDLKNPNLSNQTKINSLP